MSLETIIAGLFKWIWGIITLIFGAMISYVGWNVKKDRERLDKHQSAIAQLEAKSVDETKVREIIKEELHPLSEDIKEIKELVSANTKIVGQLSVEIARQQGYQEAMKENKAQSTRQQ